MKTYAFKEKYANPRAVLQQCFMDSAENDERFIVLSPDISRSSLGDFIKKYPQLHLNMGIAEQNAIDFSAGLALEGKVPVVFGMATFLSMRSCEQIRTNLCYQGCNVKVISYSSGITGNGGSTHSSLEDLAIMRLFPDMTVVLPGDPGMVAPLFKAIYEHEGPVYMRIAGSFPEICVYDEPCEYVIGKGVEVLEGSDATIIATGITLAYAVEAGKMLQAEGIKASVIDMHTLKPIDRELIIRKGKETGRIVTVEDHSIFGGLGTAVAEVIAEENIDCRLKRLGVPDTFPGYGTYEQLTAFYGFDEKGIAEAVKSMM